MTLFSIAPPAISLRPAYAFVICVATVLIKHFAFAVSNIERVKQFSSIEISRTIGKFYTVNLSDDIDVFNTNCTTSFCAYYLFLLPNFLSSLNFSSTTREIHLMFTCAKLQF